MQVDDVNYSASVKVEFKDGSKTWLEVFKTNVEAGLSAMAESVRGRATLTVPRKNHYLAESGRVEGTGLEREVIFGSASVPYAGYQERGMAFDGSRVVRKYTTAGTGPRYLQNAFETVLKQGIGSYMK
jgi:hypothetical protein